MHITTEKNSVAACYIIVCSCWECFIGTLRERAVQIVNKSYLLVFNKHVQITLLKLHARGVCHWIGLKLIKKRKNRKEKR